jgi:hypothetical protein
MSAVWPVLSELDARVLRATDARCVRIVERVAERAGCGEDVAKSVLRRLRVRMLVEDDGCSSERLAAHLCRRGRARASAVIPGSGGQGGARRSVPRCVR